MPLPDNQTPWPLPGTDRKILRDMQEHAAWFSGDPTRLRDFYSSSSRGTRPSQQARGGGVVTRVRQFWGRRGTDDSTSERLQLHVPIAGDIATTSADLLFSEAPSIQIAEAFGDPIGVDESAEEELRRRTEADQATRTEAKRTQERLEEILEEAGIQNSLLEAAEIMAAIGGAYLRPVWDADLADHPLLTVVQADEATPTFRFGVLTEVTFHRELQRDGNKVTRHLEHHEKGVILHGLYEGTTESLGRQIPLTEHNETAGLADSLDNGNEIRLEGFDDLFVRYVPNMRPNRKHRGSYLGRSDLQGIEGLMDALDETYTSWMRDIRIGQARVIVAQQYLTGPRKQGEGAMFDLDKELFTSLDFDPTDETKGITPIEFNLRATEHAETASALLERAVSNAGYSAQSFGLKGDAPVTATEIRTRERKSFATRAKKERYIVPPVADILEIMLFIDKAVFGRDHEVLRPTIGLADSVAETAREIAESVQMLGAARAASTKTRVQMVHPDWSDEQVAAEVEAINAEEGSSVPDLLPGEFEG